MSSPPPIPSEPHQLAALLGEIARRHGQDEADQLHAFWLRAGRRYRAALRLRQMLSWLARNPTLAPGESARATTYRQALADPAAYIAAAEVLDDDDQ